MSLKKQIDADLKQAMLARDSFKTGVLRDLKSAFTYEEVAKIKRDVGLDNAEIEAVIAREVKKRNDAIEIYVAAGDKARAEKEMAEKEILTEYLPDPLTENELRDIISRVITTGGFGASDIGRVIGDVKREVGSQADGATIARIVKETLQ
jgi:uncharacterized protein YqeY